jgi:hypothetical protein
MSEGTEPFSNPENPEVPATDGAWAAAAAQAASPAAGIVPATVAPQPAAAPAAPPSSAGVPDTAEGVWRALGILGEPTDLSQHARAQAAQMENAVFVLGKGICGLKSDSTRTKSELRQVNTAVKLNKQAIEDLQIAAGDDSKMKAFMAEMSEMRESMRSENVRLQQLLDKSANEVGTCGRGSGNAAWSSNFLALHAAV